MNEPLPFYLGRTRRCPGSCDREFIRVLNPSVHPNHGGKAVYAFARLIGTQLAPRVGDAWCPLLTPVW